MGEGGDWPFSLFGTATGGVLLEGCPHELKDHLSIMCVMELPSSEFRLGVLNER